MNAFPLENPANENPKNTSLAIQKFLHDDMASAITPATTFTYDCIVTISIRNNGTLVVEFKQNKSVVAIFEGSNVGALGGYTGWGSAWLKHPLDILIGQSAELSVELVRTQQSIALIQISQSNSVIGGCSTNGIGIGNGLGTGQGVFKTG